MLMRRHLVLLAILGAALAVGIALLIQGLSNPLQGMATSTLKDQGGSDPGVAIILSDARDGRVDGKWSCPSMRYVADRVPVLVYSKPLASLRDATGRTCNWALKQLQPGASRSRVVSVLGRPDRLQDVGSIGGRSLPEPRATVHAFASPINAFHRFRGRNTSSNSVMLESWLGPASSRLTGAFRRAHLAKTLAKTLVPGLRGADQETRKPRFRGCL